MPTMIIVLVILLILAARMAANYGFYTKALNGVSVAGGILVLLLIAVQCMTSDSEGLRGGRRGRRGRRGRAGRRAVNRVLHGGRGGWTGYVPWWLYPSYYFPWMGGWSPYPDPYPPGYGPAAYLPNIYPVGPCAAGCMADSTGSYGCPNPGYYPGQCRFASDCAGCAPGGVPAVAIV